MVRSINGRTVFASSKVDYGAVQIESSQRTAIPLEPARVALGGQSRFFERDGHWTFGLHRIVEVITPEQPWAYGAAIDLRIHEPLPHDGLIVVVGRAKEGVLAITLFDDAEKEPLCRKTLAPAGDGFDALVAQATRHKIETELILVEWNPPKDRPSLCGEVRWPPESSCCEIRIITVGPELHDRYKHFVAFRCFRPSPRMSA